MKRALVFCAVFFLLFAPTLVFAQNILAGPIVTPCSGPICQACDLIKLAQNVINFAIAFTVVVATLMFVYAGILYVTAAANPKQIAQAHGVFVNVFVGFIVVLAAWLIVSMVLSVLTKGDLAFWSGQIQCVTQPTAQQTTTQTPSSGTPTQPTTPSGTACSGCVSLSSLGVQCKDPASCTVNSQVASKLNTLSDLFTGGWQVTEAYPPTRTHKAACHTAGTCVDVGFTGSTAYNQANIDEFSRAAKNAGLRPVFETSNATLASQVRASGHQVLELPNCNNVSQGTACITGNHFSVYNL